ncbi:magnesium-chelatase subunit ChlH [Pycnococcus provasolii]
MPTSTSMSARIACVRQPRAQNVYGARSQKNSHRSAGLGLGAHLAPHSSDSGGRRPTRTYASSSSASASSSSPAEQFSAEILAMNPDDDDASADASAQEEERLRLANEVSSLQTSLDDAYSNFFSTIDERINDEAAFKRLALEEDGETFSKIMQSAETKPEWTAFQRDAASTRLLLDRARAKLEKHIQNADARQVLALAEDEDEEKEPATTAAPAANVVLITGFESFNVSLYNSLNLPKSVSIKVFSDRDIESNPEAVESALAQANAVFMSLLFDYDQVEWLNARIKDIPTRLVFESALELMSSTRIGTFTMKPPKDGKKAGPPPAVKAILSKFGSNREEDKLVGYLSFLKIGPALLRFVPGEKARDLRNWLQIYAYWNQAGKHNVEQAFLTLAKEYLLDESSSQRLKPQKLIETPALGVYHPDYDKRYFTSLPDYMTWYRQQKPNAAKTVVGMLLYRKHVITNQPYIDQLIRRLECEDLLPVPVFINGVEAHTVVRDLFTTEHEIQQVGSSKLDQSKQIMVDAIVSTIGFPLVGGPAGTMEAGRQQDIASTILQSKNVPYVVAAPLLIQDMASWARDGIAGLQSVVLYSLPELDGAIDTVTLGGLVGDDIFLAEERVVALARRLKKWVSLRRKPESEKRIAVILYGFPPGVGATGTAALLNVPNSLDAMIARLADEGYQLSNDGDRSSLPTGESIVEVLRQLEGEVAAARGMGAASKAVEKAIGSSNTASAGGTVVSPSLLKEWLSFPESYGPTEWGPLPFLPSSDLMVRNMQSAWGDLRAYRGIKTAQDGSGFVVAGVQCGNVFFGVQPALGVEGDPMRLLFERDLTPHPQYAAFYKWLSEDYEADAVLHMGMHGTVEWLPGSPLGNTGYDSWSDTLLADLPNVYVYAANNPSESVVAKRRGYGTLVSYNVPPYGRSGLYAALTEARAVLTEYREAQGADVADVRLALREQIMQAIEKAGLTSDVPFPGDAEDVQSTSPELFDRYADDVYGYLSILEQRLFSSGLHTLGQKPTEGVLVSYLEAYFGDSLSTEAVAAVCAGKVEVGGESLAFPAENEAKLREAIEIKQLLERTPEELDGVVRALNGEFVPPATGGDLLRDGPGVLPTGRNVHALDPYRMPSASATTRGGAVARAILAKHVADNDGVYPETVSVNLWGLDAIKTKGESVAVALELVGARAVAEGTGRVARFELIPLDELQPPGRPRVDVLCNMSGIFRDTFANVVSLLDDLFERAAAADEPEERNFIRKHTRAMEAQGIERGTARLFSNPAGDYGSMVNERVGAGNWTSGDELGDTWVNRNSFSYGRGGERGEARPEVLNSLLATTDRVVQAIDSVEYGLTDIQEYYANTGALLSAARSAKAKSGADPSKVGCSIVETFGDDDPKELDETLRMEYRTRLLNPRWAEAMSEQGSGGAFEISQRFTAMVGWAGTAGFQDDFVYDQSFETYVADEAMREKLREANPEAFKNVVRRMLELHGRGFWDADDERIKELQELYSELDTEVEMMSAEITASK